MRIKVCRRKLSILRAHRTVTTAEHGGTADDDGGKMVYLLDGRCALYFCMTGFRSAIRTVLHCTSNKPVIARWKSVFLSLAYMVVCR